jgi:Tfp pilus assembly protein PilW
MTKATAKGGGEAGFSLVDLMIALGITLVIMVMAGRLLAMSMTVRQRELQRSEAVADVQRALQVMTREISNAGLGMSNNGLVPANCDALAIRVRTNLNAFCSADPAAPPCDNNTTGPGEDVAFAIINNTTNGNNENQTLITRQDVNSGAVSALANRIDGLTFQYIDKNGAQTADAAQAQRVRITVWVTLLAVGTKGQPGYQPDTQMQLNSEAVLRNLLLDK